MGSPKKWNGVSLSCVLKNVVQWILTAGLIEESFKFAALLRLRPTAKRLRSGARCWPSFALPKAWWMRLADSPIAVALCGVAAGGGFATTENFMYIFSEESIHKAFREDDLESAYARIAA